MQLRIFFRISSICGALLIVAAMVTDAFAPTTSHWIIDVICTGAVGLLSFGGGWIGAAIALIALPIVTHNEPTGHLFGEWIEWIAVSALMILSRQSLLRLHRADSKLRALFKSIDELILVLDKDGTYVEIAATNRAMLYRPEEQLIGCRVHDVFPGEAADWIVAQIRRALAADSPIDVDYPLVIDGKTVWFNASVTRLNESSVIWVARDITARKLAEVELEARVADRTQDLQDSKERYRSVFDQAEEVIYTLSRDGIITSLNPAFEQILGWSRDEWIGKPFMGLVPAEMFAQGTELFARLLRDGKIDLSRFIALAKDGRRVAFEFSVVEQILHGKSVGFLGIARDITERELAEERLRRSERQLAEAQRIAKVGSWEHDLTTRTMWWSEEAYRIFGREPRDESIPYERFLDFLRPNERSLIEAFHDALIARGEYSTEILLHTATGEAKVLNCHGRLVRDSNGNSKIMGAFQDVTERRRGEEKLRESEERFRLATLATSDAIWDVDVTTSKSWHSEGYRTFGYAPETVKDGYNWWVERIHPADRDRVLAIRNEAFESGQPSWSTEYQFRRANGTYAYVLHRALIVRDEAKKPVRIVGAIMDLTERKQLLDQLEQAKRVSSLGRVAASIAHEFNNILMGIQPNIEVIQRSSPSGLRTVTNNIMRAVLRGKRVTDEILRFTRPTEPSLQCIEVAPFFSSWREGIEPQLGPAVGLVLDTPVDAIHISADPTQLAQIFTNLALNARDAMQDRGGRLMITAHLSNSFGTFPFGVIKTPDRFIHFTVSDEGCGISSDRLAHIFEPLFTTKRDGVGLGLAMTYQIVTRHEGHIFVESEVGRGSTFHVFIPASLPAVAEAESTNEDGFASLRKLLLVEDEPAVASGITMLLEMEGINVETVYTGRESIPAIERFSPDAVILDIGLPDMDGVGVYLEIESRWPELPVLFSSGHGDSAKLETYLARRNVGFLLKPYDFDAMRVALSQLVERKPAVKTA